MKECTMKVKTWVRFSEGMRGHDLGFWVLKHFSICVLITQMITLGVYIYIYIYIHTHICLMHCSICIIVQVIEKTK